MRIITNIKDIQKIISSAKRRGKTVGFVQTMGALHQGHAALLRKARRESGIVVLSIFVNPTQFGHGEDFKKYPREKAKDVLLAKREKVDIIFYPSVNKIYPTGFLTSIKVAKLSNELCGKFRPGHFDGVAIIVVKLLNIISPDTLYVGQKDAQQCAVLKHLIYDLNIPVKIRICPTVREHDGLAMSSRNKYLSEKERKEAPALYQALREAQQHVQKGERRTVKIIQRMTRRIHHHSSGRIQYIACVQADTLVPLKHLKGRVLIALAVYFGKARLIDNIAISV